MAEAQPGPPRSVNNNTPTFVTFINSTGRMVYLFWIGYEGELVRYGHIPPRKGTSMNTYVTHPWIARDAVTWYPLLLNGEQIFHPEAERGGHVFHGGSRERVSIRIPVFPLHRRCMEIVYLYYKPDFIARSDIPNELKETILKMSPRSDFNTYRNYERIQYQDEDLAQDNQEENIDQHHNIGGANQNAEEHNDDDDENGADAINNV